MKSITLFAILTLASFHQSLLLASPANQQTDDKEAIFNNAKAFVDAFEKGDASAVAGFWAEDGEFVDLTGRRLQGRPAIEDAFKDFFAENKGMKLRLDVNSVRLVTPDTAIEDGITSLISPDGTSPSHARYTNVHVKKDGQWVLESVREVRPATMNTCAAWNGLLANGLMRETGRKSATSVLNGRQMVISSSQPRT